MSTPISSNNQFSGVRPPTPASVQRPSDPSTVDQAAEEFAALLGAEHPEQPHRTEDVKDRDEKSSSSSESSGETRSESDSGRPTEVGRRGRRDEKSGDDKSDEQESQEQPTIRSLGDAILDGMSKTAPTGQVDAAPPPDAAGFDH